MEIRTGSFRALDRFRKSRVTALDDFGKVLWAGFDAGWATRN